MEKRMGAITIKGNPTPLLGKELKVGDTAPEFVLVGEGMKEVKLSDTHGKTRLLVVVTSLDTGTCEFETVRFSNTLGKNLPPDLAVYVISADLPFAQGRFCAAKNIEGLKTLSSYRSHKFGEDYGILIDGLLLLARTIFIVDGNGKVTYKQSVIENSHEPDYDSVLAALKIPAMA